MGAHSRRVARWARELGGVSGLSPDELIEIEIGGQLHEVGYLAATQRVVEVVGKTTEPQILHHPSAGYAVLSRFPGFSRIADAVLHHHERFDGEGFPHKLWGQKIPLMARILAVTDAFDLALHPGATLVAHDAEEARRYLAKERGKALDPDLVSKFLFLLTTVDPIRRFDENQVEMSSTALRPGMVLSRDLRSINKVLLLRADTLLTQEMIDRVLSSNNYDWLVTLAYVDAESIREDLPAEVRAEEMASGMEDRQRAGKSSPGSGPRMKILIVDDSTAVCNALRRELGRVGMDVTGLTTIKAATEALEAQSYDAVILDLMLEGTARGTDILKFLTSRRPEIHCIVLSGFPTPENIRMLKGYDNVVRFVTKPWAQAVLLAAVREAVDRTRARR